MHIIPQIEALLSHVIAQLSYRWLALPPQFFSQDRIDISQLQVSEWLSYLKAALSEPAGLRPWVQQFHLKQLSPSLVVDAVYANIQMAHEAGGELIDFYHPAYPELLKHIPDPPNAFFAKGAIELLKQPKIAIVGSRKASYFALEETRRLAYALAARSKVIVSGGAFGCDAAAHLGALQSMICPTPTIVVFAGGLHKLYPEGMSKLFDSLAKSSALFISERLWLAAARPLDFPIRNRIIAGLAHELLVMQAGDRSGALHSANYALDQGRDVYVLTHEIDEIRAKGSARLIDDGACPFASGDDFLSYSERFSSRESTH